MDYAVLDTVREILAGPNYAPNVPVLDELTGTYAARFGVLRLEEEAERALRYRHSLSCFVLDVDRLDEVNRKHSEARGDRVLQDVGTILRHAVRASDVVCRLDGDRFLLVTPRLDARAGEALADRIRQRIARHRFPVPGGPAITVTASLGVACVASDVANAEALVHRALDALAVAKAAGGNKVALG